MFDKASIIQYFIPDDTYFATCLWQPCFYHLGQSQEEIVCCNILKHFHLYRKYFQTRWYFPIIPGTDFRKSHGAAVLKNSMGPISINNNLKMLGSHHKYEAVLRPPYLYNFNIYTDKISLFGNGPEVVWSQLQWGVTRSKNYMVSINLLCYFQ